MTTILQSLRLPRGLWADLEASVIQQDRQFLTEVARSLGLPVRDVLQKCLGTTGSNTQVQVLIGAYTEEDLDRCPWWDMKGEGIWHPCSRLRLSPVLPCQLHKRMIASPTCCLGTDIRLANMPKALPVRYSGQLYWICTDPSLVFREDGTLEGDLIFKRLTFKGRQQWFVLKPNPSNTQ